jgi:hypothetical protein
MDVSVVNIAMPHMIPASQAITREKFPPAEQEMAMALYSMGGDAGAHDSVSWTVSRR